MPDSSATAVPIEVPLASLSEDAASAVLESFVLGEGTDYGVELTLDTKVSRLRKQIENGKACLVYDPSTETISFVTREELRKYLTARQ